MNKPVTRVPSVYGGHVYVSTADLDNPRRIFLPLYTRTGRLWEETRAGQVALRNHYGTTIHRENIGPELSSAEAVAAE